MRTLLLLAALTGIAQAQTFTLPNAMPAGSTITVAPPVVVAPPTCPPPQPANLVTQATCPSGTTGSYQQTASFTCQGTIWTQSPFSPTTPPSGSCTANTTPPPTGTFWVYYNGVYNWGGDYSFVAVPNYQDTAGVPLTGKYDISVKVTGAYGGFLPFAGGTVPLWNFDASPYTKLTFALKAPSSNYQLYFVKVGDVTLPQSCWVQNLGVEPNVGTFTANQWSTFTIPLSRFCIGTGLTGGTAVYKFAVQDQTGKLETFYLDNVGFSN